MKFLFSFLSLFFVATFALADEVSCGAKSDESKAMLMRGFKGCFEVHF